MRSSIPRSGAWALLLLVALAVPAAAQSPSPDSQHVQRLAALGRLWGVVKYFHPAFLSRAIDWDSAVVVAIPKVGAARSTAEYAAAVRGLLAALGDPATRVVAAPRPAAQPGSAAVTTRWEADSTLVVCIPSFRGDSVVPQLRATAALIAAARRVVFDLRGPAPSADEYGYTSYWFGAAGLNSLLPSRPVAAPAERRRMYSGFPPQAGGTSGGYWSGTYELAQEVFRPAADNPERRVAFVASAWSDVPAVAWALQVAGQGVVVLDSAQGAAPTTSDIDVESLGEGLQVQMAVGAMVDRYGNPLEADTALALGAPSDAPLDAALDLIRRPRGAPRTPASRAAFVPPPENAFADMHYPALPYRILAAYRWWNAIQYFYPYKALMGEDWNAVLAQSIPKLEAARDSTEYGLAVAEMVSRIHDSHGFVGSAALRAYFGAAPVGVLLQYVEGRPVVVRVADDSATKASGIAVGDVILRVDGENVAARRARLACYLAHSTPQALDNAVASRLLGGPEGSVASLDVSGAGQRVHTVALPRRVALYRDLQFPRTGPILRRLPGGIGYADLARLTVPMVDSMFDMFRGTKAIIFDGRGYPQGTAWAIAPRLTDRTGVVAARFRRPLVMAPDSFETSTYAFTQSIPTTDKWRYHGKTVMLMDERTISQAEHTGLFFEAANHTTFIGSPTQGANGDVTTVVLPGGIMVGLTGHDVRHADGRQLQRVGLVPDILVRPTIAGIRAGRDEVLERALSYLRAGRSAR